MAWIDAAQELSAFISAAAPPHSFQRIDQSAVMMTETGPLRRFVAT
jgi:hypothetical protein